MLARIIQKLQEDGVDYHLVAFKPTGTEGFPGCEHLYKDLKNIEIIEVDERNNDAAMLNAYIDASASYIKVNQHKYDRVILDSWYTALAGILARSDQDKTYHLVQSDPYFEPENDDVRWKSRALELVPYFPFKRIVVSRSIQKMLEDRYGERHPAIDLFIDDVYRQIDFEVVNRPSLRFITTASDFTLPSKGLDFLLSSLQKLEDKNFSLTILSSVPINQKLTGLGFPVVASSVQGAEQMAKALATHDVYVNTSTNETFCLALAEAITLGMPAIALDSIGNRDYANGDNYIFVKEKSDFTGQLEHIRKLNIRKQLHEAARPSMSHYTIDQTVDEFKKIIGLI